MTLHRRFGTAVATLALGAVALFGIAACRTSADAAGETLATPEQSALAALGFDPLDLAAASYDGATPSPGTDGHTKGDRPFRKLRLAHVALRRNVLHGEATVQTKNGVVTIQVQRGTVTAIDDKTMTVKSADGFTVTWTFGDPIHVVEHRTQVQPSSIVVGTEVGVAGPVNSGTTTARLIVIPNTK